MIEPGQTPWRDRVVTVTGAAQGIGAAIARRFAKLGASLVLADSQPLSNWDDVVRETRGSGAAAVTAHVVDVRSRDSCIGLADAVDLEHGRLDILVNNAGINIRHSAIDTGEAEWREVLDVNLTGTFHMSRAALQLLRRSTDPSVVNMGSTAGVVAVAGGAAYGVSKAAILHLTRILALEWATDRIRVNAVAPTIVPTPMTSDVSMQRDYMAAKLSTIPLGRMVSPDEVAAAVAYLASTEAAMVTGHTLLLDGGVTIS